MKKRLTYLMSFLVGIALFSGCGGECGNCPRGPSLSEAWNTFASGDYSAAQETFHAVIVADPNAADAYNGLGWSFAFENEFDSALACFERALEIDSTIVDPLAGISAIWLAQGEYAAVPAVAGLALTLDPNWLFPYLDDVDYRDLHLIMAEAYFAQGEDWYPDALGHVKFLDPECTLSPDHSETWNGHPTYAAALLKKIESLEATIGAEMIL